MCSCQCSFRGSGTSWYSAFFLSKLDLLFGNNNAGMYKQVKWKLLTVHFTKYQQKCNHWREQGINGTIDAALLWLKEMNQSCRTDRDLGSYINNAEGFFAALLTLHFNVVGPVSWVQLRQLEWGVFNNKEQHFRIVCTDSLCFGPEYFACMLWRKCARLLVGERARFCFMFQSERSIFI